MDCETRRIEDVDYFLRKTFARSNRDNCASSPIFRDMRGGGATHGERMSAMDRVADAAIRISRAKGVLRNQEIVLLVALYTVPEKMGPGLNYRDCYNVRKKAAMAETVAYELWRDQFGTMDREFVAEVCRVWCGLPRLVSIDKCSVLLGRSRSQLYRDKRDIEVVLGRQRVALLTKLQGYFDEWGYL